MKNMTLIRNLLLAAVMAVGMTESSVAATSWFNGGVNANWPTDATGGEWSCQNIANLKWTETFIPGVDTTVPGVTLDNWAYVGLKFTATQALGLSDDVTEATFSTTVLLAPVLKEEMPSVDSADKGGVLLVHEDDGSLRYYVVAQNDETNGTGANVWKLASSIPRVTVDAAPVVIGIRFYRDGERWLVDYTVDGVTEPPHVVSFGSASTIDSVRFTGPCTVQSLSATFESQSTPPVDPPDEPVDPPEEPTDEPTQMFYIGEAGYDSFADVMVAVKNGDTIKVGKNATFSVSALGGKSITFDLCGRTLTWEPGGYVTSGSITVIDSDAHAGSFEFASGNRNYQTLVDMSALTKDQLTGSGKFWSGATTKVVFPADMPFDSALKFMDNKVSGEQIVVQGVTYTFDGSAWISDSPVVTYSITITPPQNGTLTASAISDIAAGTTITVTATPATGYQLVSVTTNGAPITGSSFTMPAADVMLAATFEELSPTPVDPTQMFYIGETGYDSWAEAYSAAKNGDTIKVGKNAEFAVSGGKAITIDLCGRTLKWNASGWAWDALAVTDTVGNGALQLVPDNRNVGGMKLDLSTLNKDQLTDNGKFWVDATTEIKFPQGMSLEDSKSRIANPKANMKIVVQGATYTYDGSAWVSDSPAATYSITITAPQNGTLETSVTNDVAAGTTVTVTATPATGYQLVSVTTNGAPISGSSFTMPAADVTLAATFEELPPTPPAGLVWTTVEGVPSDWSPLANNLLAGKNGTTTGTTSYLTPVANNIGKITDGVVPTNRKYSEMLGFAKDATVSWNFDAPKTLEKIRITTCDITDGRMYDDIHIADVLVKKSGADEWVSLGCGSVDWKGTDGQGIMLYVSLEDAATGYVAKDVTGLQIKFGQHNNVAQYYSEIEAVGYASGEPEEAYDITITAPQNGTLETSVTNDVAAGATVTVTATPATGYQLVSVTTNGAPITGSSFTMPAADVTLAATFEELPPTPPDEPTQMFYIGETGYDSWAEAKAAARDGDTIKVGKDAVIPNPGGTLSGSVPIDLCGRSLTFEGGWLTSGSFKFIDLVGGGVLSMPNGLNCSTTLDLSGLSGEQVVGINKNIKVGDSKSLVKFPEDWDLDTCRGCVNSPVADARIVVQGVTYKWNGSNWVSDRVRIFDVDCELATDGTHAKFQIMIATNWLAMAFGEICPDGEVADANAKELIEEKLNAADAVNGLNHVWMNYVLGAMLPGDEDGRIWIRADQTSDPSALRFRTQEFSPIQDCGFSVRFRLPEKTSADDDFVRGDTYSASSTFEASVASDTLTHRVIDMIFIPDGSKTSCEYVTTVNTAGVLKVVSDKKVNLLSAPWCGFSPTNNPAVKATDFVKASCLSEGDVLYVYDRENQNYLAWAVQPDGTWAAVKTYILDNGVVTESAADATRTNDIPRGVGVWLERKDTTKPIYLYGQVDASSVTTSLESGFNLIANPYPTAFDASKLAEPSVTGDQGDRIVIPTGGAPINAYYENGSWGWYHDEEVEIVEGVWGVSSTWTTKGLTVPAGQGFWYLNSGTDAVELDWPTSADGKDE